VPVAPSDKHLWYLIHPKPRQETTALTNLERQGYTCYLPKISKTTGRGSNIRKAAEPMFPRYLFIQLNEGKADCNGHNWMPIRSTLGVDKLVQFGDNYPSLDNALIQTLQQRERDTPVQPVLKQGDTVQTLDEPFKDLEAIFHTADSDHRVIILMNFLNQRLPVRIDSGKVRKRA
jgi:transcriptional antiterminator RfaH